MITCFFVRAEHRGKGLMEKLADAAAKYARRHGAIGATLVEAFPVRDTALDVAGS